MVTRREAWQAMLRHLLEPYVQISRFCALRARKEAGMASCRPCMQRSTQSARAVAAKNRLSGTSDISLCVLRATGSCGLPGMWRGGLLRSNNRNCPRQPEGKTHFRCARALDTRLQVRPGTVSGCAASGTGAAGVAGWREGGGDERRRRQQQEGAALGAEHLGGSPLPMHALLRIPFILKHFKTPSQCLQGPMPQAAPPNRELVCFEGAPRRVVGTARLFHVESRMNWRSTVAA